MPNPDEELTVVLRQAHATHDPGLEERVFALVKDHLKVLAYGLMRNCDGDATFQPTLLVDEAFLRLMRGAGAGWENRSAFFRLAHGTMKRILATHRCRKRPGRLETNAIAYLEDRSHSPSRPMEEADLLRAISGALQDFLDDGDPELVNTFLLSFFHRVGKAAGMRAEDLIAEFTGDRAPLRQVADAKGLSIPTAWRRLGAALEILRGDLRKRGFE